MFLLKQIYNSNEIISLNKYNVMFYLRRGNEISKSNNVKIKSFPVDKNTLNQIATK